MVYNLCELLKDSIGKTFYCVAYGDVILEGIYLDFTILRFKRGDVLYDTYKDGSFCEYGECLIFPSKENRDWSTYKKKKDKPEYVPFTFDDYERLIGKPVKSKSGIVVDLIIGLNEDGINVNKYRVGYDFLFENYTFVNGSPCGKLKK